MFSSDDNPEVGCYARNISAEQEVEPLVPISNGYLHRHIRVVKTMREYKKTRWRPQNPVELTFKVDYTVCFIHIVQLKSYGQTYCGIYKEYILPYRLIICVLY